MKSFSEPELFQIDQEVTIEMPDYKIEYREVKGNKEKCYVKDDGTLLPVWPHHWIVNNIKKKIAAGFSEQDIYIAVSEWAATTGNSKVEEAHCKDCLEKYYQIMEAEYQTILAETKAAPAPRKSLFKKG